MPNKLIKDKPIILVKIGTNLLTKTNQKLDYKTIAKIVGQIAKLKKEFSILIVSSGAVGAGREIVLPEIKDPITQKQVLASVGQVRLLQIYFELFSKKNISIAQALITKSDFQHRESYYSTKEILSHLIKQGIIPIINENDVTSSFGNTFGDNDQLAALTASLIQAEKMILLTDTTGLFTDDPKKNTSAQLITKIDKITDKTFQYAKKTMSKGGSGGMYSKIQAAKITTEHGIETVLCDGKQKNALINAIKSENYGTLFVPQKKKQLSLNGKWIKTAARIKGKVVIDSGAYKAIQLGKSLLAVGIKSLEGDFVKKDIITIVSESGIRFAVGMCREDADSLRELIKQSKTKGVTFVHRDYLYFL